MGGGVPLVGPQEELRGLAGYTPTYFESKAEGKVKHFAFYNNKQTNKQTQRTCDKQTNREV